MDLDGTLSMPVNRLHLMPTEKLGLTESWSEFNMAAGTDEVSNSIKTLYHAVSSDLVVVILTGRCDVSREVTTGWLDDKCVIYDMLIMREEGDNRKDTVIKEEILRQIGLDNIAFAVDDDPGVIAHFRSLGITTLDVGTPDSNRDDVQNHGSEHQ